MHVTETHPDLEPVFGLVKGHHEFGTGWRIRGKSFEGVMCLRNPTRDLKFASHRDCELAIEGFRQAGLLTKKQLTDISDIERLRIATQFLQW